MDEKGFADGLTVNLVNNAGLVNDALPLLKDPRRQHHLHLVHLRRPANSNEFGRAVWAADVDGDGDPDVLVGEPGALNSTTTIPGYVRIFDGPSGSELFRFDGAAVGERFGYAVGAAVLDNSAGKSNVAGGACWGYNPDPASTLYAGSVRIFGSPSSP